MRTKDWDENPEIINVHVKKDYSNQEEDKKDDKPGNKSWERIFKTKREGGERNWKLGELLSTIIKSNKKGGK